MNLNTIKELIRYFYEKPSALFCSIAIWGVSIMYQDNREFIKEQQTILKEISNTQSNIQHNLVELNVRISQLERKDKEL